MSHGNDIVKQLIEGTIDILEIRGEITKNVEDIVTPLRTDKDYVRVGELLQPQIELPIDNKLSFLALQSALTGVSLSEFLTDEEDVEEDAYPSDYIEEESLEDCNNLTSICTIKENIQVEGLLTEVDIMHEESYPELIEEELGELTDEPTLEEQSELLQPTDIAKESEDFIEFEETNQEEIQVQEEPDNVEELNELDDIEDIEELEELDNIEQLENTNDIENSEQKETLEQESMLLEEILEEPIEEIDSNIVDDTSLKEFISEDIELNEPIQDQQIDDVTESLMEDDLPKTETPDELQQELDSVLSEECFEDVTEEIEQVGTIEDQTDNGCVSDSYVLQQEVNNVLQEYELDTEVQEDLEKDHKTYKLREEVKSSEKIYEEYIQEDEDDTEITKEDINTNTFSRTYSLRVLGDKEM